MKKISLLLCCLLVLSLFAACGGSQQSSSVAESSSTEAEQPGQVEEQSDADDEGKNQEATEAGGVLIMATEAGFKPYEYYEGDEIIGVDVDIAREIADALGMELKVEHMEFGSIIPAVNSGKAHFGAAGMSITEERALQVDFTIEYATSKQVILTTADSDIMAEADLDGRQVGVQMGTVADLVLTDDYPDVSVVQYYKYFEAANDLLSGRIDAIVLDSLPAEEISKMNESLVIREEELFTDVYAFCVKKGNEELLESINEVMQRLVDEGKVAEFTAVHSAD